MKFHRRRGNCFAVGRCFPGKLGKGRFAPRRWRTNANESDGIERIRQQNPYLASAPVWWVAINSLFKRRVNGSFCAGAPYGASVSPDTPRAGSW